MPQIYLRDRLSNTELIERVATRDREAFEILYKRYAPRVYAYLSSQIRQREVVEETVNDVMMVVWDRAHRYNGTAQVSTWILGIAYYKALTARARAGAGNADIPDTSPTDVPDNDPERDHARHECTEIVKRVLATLPPEERAVIELTYYHDRSYAEIGEILNCPVNTVKTRMLRARRRLALVIPNDCIDEYIGRTNAGRSAFPQLGLDNGRRHYV